MGTVMTIYDLLNRIIKNKQYELKSSLFCSEDREQLCEEEQDLFDLLKRISSIKIDAYNSEVKFCPMFVWPDGRHTFSVEDISEENFTRIMQLEYDKVPLTLRALISDIVWNQKKDFNAAKVAANAYWELFKLWYDEEDNIGALDMIRRAVCISHQTKQSALYEEICCWFSSFLNSENLINKDIFLTLRIMELFMEQKNFDVSIIVPVLDKILVEHHGNFSVMEQTYKIKTICMTKLKEKKAAVENDLALADYYIWYAEKTVKANIQELLRAIEFYRKGIKLYRNNGEPQKAENAHRRLVEIQKNITGNMEVFSTKWDITGVVQCIRTNMEGLTFEESIVRLTQICSFDSQEKIKKRVVEECRKYPIPHICEEKTINKQGQTILVLPPLNIHNVEEDLELLELHMHRNALEKQNFVGDVWISNALEILREKFTISNTMLDFLIKENPIVPEGRECIIRNGIGMFLNGEYYEAMHILAPQIENIFRNIAREVGGLTVTLEDDGSSMEKVLSSIFSLPELLDCYDNDILFTFKGLLNEQAGANIRNEVAHGIIDEKKCSSGACLFFGVALIKLLLFTSTECHQIINNSKKLKHFEMPNQKLFKEVQESGEKKL